MVKKKQLKTKSGRRRRRRKKKKKKKRGSIKRWTRCRSRRRRRFVYVLHICFLKLRKCSEDFRMWFMHNRKYS